MNFYVNQPVSEQQEYKHMLAAAGSLSNLFSESGVPYLYYRAAENIFCRAFHADNLSRGDVSADASKDRIGIGLKTFLHKNGNTLQKVAEFNKDMSSFADKSPAETIQLIAEMRNERIEFTKRAHGLQEMLYHMVTRKESGFELYEEPMHLIDLSTIRNIKKEKNSIHFQDKHAVYSFYLPKSTLQKRFLTDQPIAQIPVEVLDDPYTLLKQGRSENYMYSHGQQQMKTLEYVYLPLYSPRSKEVHPKSGLNQWNSLGRPRHPDEMYIPIPSWIHRRFEGFFPYNRHTDEEGTPFTLVLPDQTEIQAKVCQQDGKALMSNPNRVLGNWLLRHVLQLPLRTVLKYEMLEKIGIDSVVIYKEKEDRYTIHFAKAGSYEQFEREVKDTEN